MSKAVSDNVLKFESRNSPNRANFSIGYEVCHKRRIFSHFTRSAPEKISEQLLLEHLLFRAVPQDCVNDLAVRLLERFGDLNRVINAPERHLLRVEKVDESVLVELSVARAIAETMSHSKILNENVLTRWDEILDYCHTVMAHREREQARIIFLDNSSRVIRDEVLQEGTVNHVAIYPRQAMKRALELDACGIIVVHNHPSGDVTASQYDLDVTKQLVKASLALGIRFHDHVIIGKSKELSFRNEGLLNF